jgi:hypothetical protein
VSALQTGDAVKAAILTGPLLQDTYARLGVDPVALQRLFAQKTAQSQGSSTPLPGAALLALLSQGGSGTFRDFGQWCGATLYTEQRNYDASVASYVQLGAVQGLNLGPLVNQRAVPESVTPWPK